jgi:adenylate cyclase class 2
MEKPTQMEVEIKVPVKDIEEMKKRVVQSGGILKRERHFESNSLYDYSDRSLSASGCLLRIRELPEGALLTFKGKIVAHEKFKVRPEAETMCSDRQGIKTILHSLGFRPFFKYQKYREEYIINDTLVCVDELPFGYFLEIEGEEDKIEEVTEILSLDKSTFSKKSYASIYAEICRQEGKPFGDIIFEKQNGS